MPNISKYKFLTAQYNLITLTRGDTYSFELNIDDNGENYQLTGDDTVYFGIMDPNQRFEDALVKKKFTVDDLDPTGSLIIQIDPEDTLDLLPGRYFYAIKLLRDHLDADGTEVYNVETVVDKTKFIICD